MAVHAAEVCDEGGAVPEAAHGPRQGPLDWKEDLEGPPLPVHEEQVPCDHL